MAVQEDGAAAGGRPVGRFAPSPTGPLHFGSMVAAFGSCLHARSRGGLWQLRIEDLDRPRCLPGAGDGIVRTLERFGFEWDGPVVWQGGREPYYRAALERLREAGQAYACACSRKELAALGGGPYPGRCRDGVPRGRVARAWRVRVGPDTRLCFDDAVQGTLCETLAQTAGDFVVLRADGYFAYQLAVVVDDAEAGVNEVVRGHDLIDSTARQIWLQRLLGLPTPAYAHLPVVLGGDGCKLSKQTLARPVDAFAPGAVLHAVLSLLGQAPPPVLARETVSAVWQWALANWDLGKVPAVAAVAVPDWVGKENGETR